MFGLVLSATEEGAKGPKKSLKGPEGPKDPQPSARDRRRGAEYGLPIENLF